MLFAVNSKTKSDKNPKMIPNFQTVDSSEMKSKSLSLPFWALCIFLSPLGRGAVSLPSMSFSDGSASGGNNVESPQTPHVPADSPEPTATAARPTPEPPPVATPRAVTPESQNADDGATPSKSPEQKRKRMALGTAYAEAKSEPNSARQKELLGEVLERSLEILREDPDASLVWLVRADAALMLNESSVGWEAGRNMLRLGVDKLQNKVAQDTLVKLERKKWFGVSPPVVWDGIWMADIQNYDPYHGQGHKSYTKDKTYDIRDVRVSARRIYQIRSNNGVPSVEKFTIESSSEYKYDEHFNDSNLVRRNCSWEESISGVYPGEIREKINDSVYLYSDRKNLLRRSEAIDTQVAFGGKGLIVVFHESTFHSSWDDSTYSMYIVINPKNANQVGVISSRDVPIGFRTDIEIGSDEFMSIFYNRMPREFEEHITIRRLSRQPERVYDLVGTMPTKVTRVDDNKNSAETIGNLSNMNSMFFNAMWQNMLSNTAQEFSSDFDVTCKYCNSGWMTRKSIADDRQKLIDRWPNRGYELLGKPNMQVSEDGKNADLRFSYSYTYAAGARSTKGRDDVQLKLRSAPQNRWLIIDFQEKVTPDR